MKTLMNLLPTPATGDRRSKDSKQPGMNNIIDRLSSQGDFLVSLSVKQENAEAQMIIATCGLKCYELSNLQNRHGLSLKMCVEYLLLKGDWYSKNCALTWKPVITQSNRLLFQLSPSMHRTGGIGSGSLPTVTTQEVEHPHMDLTKTSRRKTKDGKDSHSVGLLDKRAMLPTPAQRDFKGAGTRNGKTTPCIVEGRTGVKTGLKLQPNFVEWMMGYPSNWTDLNSLKPSTGTND